MEITTAPKQRYRLEPSFDVYLQTHDVSGPRTFATRAAALRAAKAIRDGGQLFNVVKAA